MGSLVSRIQSSCGRVYPLEARVVMLGLDAAGKTTILYRIKLNETVSSIPTIGFNVETLEPVSGVSLVVWDVGIGYQRRLLLRHYCPAGIKALVFVVDSTDVERLSEAREMLFVLLEAKEMTPMPLIVLANKQDLEGARSPAQIALDLQLEKVSYRKWAVCGCCATTGEGLPEALHKLAEAIKDQELP